MAEPIVWADIPKSQVDPQTIDEAIIAGLAVHNADPDAHLEELASLESHRVNQILDHLEESVVNDKLKSNNRRYIAIVDPNSDTDFDTLESCLEYAASRGGGTIYMRRGLHFVSESLLIPANCDIEGDGTEETVLLANSASSVYLFMGPQDDTPYVNSMNITSVSSVSDILTISAVTPADFQYFGDGLGFLDTAGDVVLITEIIDSTHVRIHRLGTGITTGFKNLAPVIDAVDGSTEVVFPSSVNAYFVGFYPGSSIYNPDLGLYLNIIDENLDGTLILETAFGEPDGRYLFEIAGTTTQAMKLTGLSFNGGIQPLIVYGFETGPALQIENCSFQYEGTKVTANGDRGVGSVFRNCIFGSYNSVASCDVFNGNFDNCVFVAAENGAKAVASYGYCKFVNCNFAGDSSNGIIPYQNSSYGAIFTGCQLMGLNDTVILSTFAFPAIISSCVISIRSSNRLDISGTRGLVNGNVIDSLGSTGLRLITGTTRCTVVNNNQDVTTTNSGTNNTVANNNVG